MLLLTLGALRYSTGGGLELAEADGENGRGREAPWLWSLAGHLPGIALLPGLASILSTKEESSVHCDIVYPALDEHIRGFFAGRQIEPFVWTAGPTQHVLPRFRVLRVAPPAPNRFEWVYLSVGAWEVNHDAERGLEFLIVAPTEDARMVGVLAMTAYYHRDMHLDLGHTFPIGHGWLDGSVCDHMLVSLPYPFGPKLEFCRMQDGSMVRFLWLLPVTAAEARFRHEHGLEALEQRFQEARVQFADPFRESVV